MAELAALGIVAVVAVAAVAIARNAKAGVNINPKGIDMKIEPTSENEE